MTTYVCKKSCYYLRQRFNPGDRLTADPNDDIPHHFVTEDEYLGITKAQDAAARAEEEKNTREALREPAIDPENWDEHMKRKTPNFQGPIPELYCPICDQEFTSKQGQMSHMRNRHPEEEEVEITEETIIPYEDGAIGR